MVSSMNIPHDRAEPLKILFVVRDLAYHGGVPRCVLQFCQGHDPRMVTPIIASFKTPSPEMVAAMKAASVVVHCIGDRGRIAPTIALRRLVRQQQVDALIGCTLKTYIAAKMAAFGRNRPVMFWIHSIPLVIQGRIKTIIFRLLAKRDPLIFVSRAVRDAHLPPRHSGPTAVVYNGVPDLPTEDRAKIRAELMESAGIPVEPPLIGYIAEFVAWKDHATLLKGMKLLEHHPAKPHLVLIGTGELIEQTRAAAAALSLASRIHFIGTRPDARRLLAGMDVYVNPTQGEAFGLAVVEAMLASKPVVVARNGALPEYVVQDKTGWFFKPADPIGLASGVSVMLDDPNRAARIGAAARQMSLEHFSTKTYVDEITRFITSATEGTTATSAARAAPADIVSANNDEIGPTILTTARDLPKPALVPPT